MNKHVLLTIISLFLLPGAYMATAQPHLQWQKTYGGTGSEYTSSMELTPDGGYIMCGSSSSFDGDVTGLHGSSDVWVVKLSGTGAIKWQKTYGGTGDDRGVHIRHTKDSGYIVLGYTSSNNGDVTSNYGKKDFWLIKLDSAGALKWQKNYGGSENDAGNDVQQTSDGGFVLAGYTTSSDGDVTGFHGGFWPDWWIVKVDDTGAIQWQKTYGGSHDDEAIAIIETQDGGYLATGMTMSANGDITYYHGGTSDGGDCWTVKLDNMGDMEWQKTYGGSKEEQGFSLLQNTKGKYIIGATAVSSNGDITVPIGNADAWVLQLDDTGGIEWQKNYGTTGWDYLTSIAQTGDSGYVFTGWGAFSWVDDDLWVAAIDSDGAFKWKIQYGGSKSDYGWAMQVTTDGGYIVAGNTTSNDGDVSGHHGGPASATDIWVLKLSSPESIPWIHGTPYQASVYPNPVAETLYIDGAGQGTTAIIYNTTGQQVYSGELKGHSDEVPVKELAEGVYRLLLVAEGGNKQAISFSVVR